jgi:hypothetical protein
MKSHNRIDFRAGMANLYKGRLPELKQKNLCFSFVSLLLLAIFFKNCYRWRYDFG